MNFVDTLLKKLLPFQVFKKRFLINGARPSPLQTDLHNKLVERRPCRCAFARQQNGTHFWLDSTGRTKMH